MDSQLVQILGLVLVHFIWQGLLIGLLFHGVRLLLKDQSAEFRYNWAVMCLILIALAPLLTFVWLANNPASPAASSLVIMSEGFQSGAVVSASDTTGLNLSGILPWIVGLWLCGVLLMSARLGAGWWYVCQLRRRADYSIPPDIQKQLERLARRLNMSARVGLAFTSQIAGPMLIGLFRPLILVPIGLVNSLSARQVEMVLAHELSHLQRADHLVNLFQNIVETLLFYHPVVRWVSSEIRAERELVSDELAARLTGDRVGYAETLLQLEKVRGDRLPLAIGMADHQLVTRVRNLLAPRSSQSGSVITGMTLLTIIMVSALTALVSTGLQTLTQRHGPEVLTTSPRDEPTEVLAEDLVTASPASESATPATELAQSFPGVVDSPARNADVVGSKQQSASRPVPMEPAVPDILDASPRMVQIEAAPSVNETDRILQTLQTPQIEPMLPRPEVSSPDEGLMMASLATPAPVGEVRGGELLNTQVPDYPSMAARHSQEGQAEVSLIVGPNGRVIDAEVIKEMPGGYGFGEAALQAVEQWRFEPFTRNGQAIQHEIRTGFDFTDPPPCDRRTGSRISRC